jgi:hypothetical protein
MILFKVLTQKFVKDGTSQFQNFHMSLYKFHALFSEIITVRLGYHKFFTRWVPKMLAGARKMQRMAAALTLLE